jgi:PAP2 superfamily
MAGMELQAETTGMPVCAAAPGQFWPLLRLSFNAHAPLLWVAFGYLAVFQILGFAVPGMSAKAGGEVMLSIMFLSVPALFFGLLGFQFGVLVIHDKPNRPIVALWRKFRDVVSDRDRMAAGLPVFVALVTFMYVFTMVKSYITVLAPFTWDASFDTWDRALHFGYRPWELLQPVFGFWPVTFLVNLNYNMWFVVTNVFWGYYAFIARPGIERNRFFLSCMTIWIVGGGILAVLFSSAAPCYFSKLGISPDPYAPLMAYLKGADTHLPIWALDTQDMLWSLRANGSAFGGISAMPSMHNATALLFILSSSQRPLWVRRVLIAHAALIFLGSIHLGWHFAIDGYVAWIVAFAVWKVMGPVSRWWETTTAARDFEFALKTKAKMR